MRTFELLRLKYDQVRGRVRACACGHTHTRRHGTARRPRRGWAVGSSGCCCPVRRWRHACPEACYLGVHALLAPRLQHSLLPPRSCQAPERAGSEQEGGGGGPRAADEAQGAAEGLGFCAVHGPTGAHFTGIAAVTASPQSADHALTHSLATAVRLHPCSTVSFARASVLSPWHSLRRRCGPLECECRGPARAHLRATHGRRRGASERRRAAVAAAAA